MELCQGVAYIQAVSPPNTSSTTTGQPGKKERFNYKMFLNNYTRITMDVDDFQECIHSDNKIREDSILKNWISRMNNQTTLAKSFQQQLKYQMAIMRVKFPFLDESQLRGQALKNLNIPSICGQIPTLVKIIQLGSPKGKNNLLQLASYIHPKKMQCRNKKRSEIKSNNKAGLLTHNRKYCQEIENITSKTRNTIMSNASCPEGSHMTFIPKRRSECMTQKKIPQIYQDLEDTSELEKNLNNFDKHEEYKNHKNIHNVMKHNVQDVKTKTVKRDSRKLNENKENIQIKTRINKKIQEYNPQPKVKEIFDSEDLGKCNSIKQRRKISSSQNNAPKSNIKKIKNFVRNCPQIHRESEMHKTQHLPKSVKNNISNNYERGKVIKTEQDTNKQRKKTKNTFNQHIQQMKNVSETQIRKSTSISKQLDNMSDEKLIEINKPKRTARNSSFTQKEKNQGNLRISKSKLLRNVEINPLKTLGDINYKEKFMNSPSNNAKNKKDTDINENSKYYNKQKLKPKNMNLDIVSQYTTDTDKSNSTESDYEELAQLSDNARNLSKHKEQLKNRQFERDRKAMTYCKQITSIHLTTEDRCNYPNPLKVNDDFIMGQSETFKISRSSIKTKDNICYRKKVFELNSTESINNETGKYVEEIPCSIYSISDEDGNTQMNVQNDNSKGKKKTVKKRKLFCNSTSKRKTYQDIMSSSEFEESDHNAACNINENIEKNKGKQNLCLTNQKERCQDLKKSIKNMERGKIFITSICEVDRYQDKQSSVDLVESEANEESNLSGNITDESEQKSRNSKMSLNTPEETDHESSQLPLHSPVDYAFLDSFSSSEESNEATQEALKILTDDLLNYDIESSKEKCHSATFTMSLNQQDQIIMPTSCRASSEVFPHSSGKNNEFLPSNSTQSSNFNLEDNDGINISGEGDYLADLFDPLPQTDKFFYYVRPEINDDDDDEAEESCATLLDEF